LALNWNDKIPNMHDIPLQEFRLQDKTGFQSYWDSKEQMYPSSLWRLKPDSEQGVRERY
jgi:DUF2075 family protein